MQLRQRLERLARIVFPFLEDEADSFVFRWFPVLALAVVALGALAALVMLGAGLSGDENAYRDVAKAIGDYVSVRGGDAATLVRQIVGYGWFMPGMPVVISPMFVLSSDPHVIAIRLYALGFNILLWVWMLREVQRNVGSRFALALLVFPTLHITPQFFGYTIWGDLPAGMVMAIVLARLYAFGVRSVEGDPPGLGDIARLELICALMVYLRGSTLLVVVAAHVFLLVLPFLACAWRSALRLAVHLATGALMFAALIAPWSLTATRILGHPVITTSTVNLSLGITFGDASKLCDGRCATGNIWLNAAAFARQRAEATGTSELKVQKQMAQDALEGLGLRQYLRKVLRNFRSYLLEPHGFNGRFVTSSLLVPDAAEQSVISLLKWIFNPVYFLFLCGWIAANLTVVRTEASSQVLSLVVKLGTTCVLLQPFLHQSHPRYWPSFAPLIAVAAMFVVERWRSRCGAVRLVAVKAPADVAACKAETILTTIQLIYVAVLLATAALVVGLGR